MDSNSVKHPNPILPLELCISPPFGDNDFNLSRDNLNCCPDRPVVSIRPADLLCVSFSTFLSPTLTTPTMLLTISRTNILRSIDTTSRFAPLRRSFASATDATDTQNLIEKIVQKYAVDLPEGYKVKSGDYITIRPHHVLTHDNTGAVIPKQVQIERDIMKLYLFAYALVFQVQIHRRHSYL